MEERIARLVARLDGAIKYAPMLKDHPDWSDDECIAFAEFNHARAIAGLRRALELEKAGYGTWDRQIPRWNEGIPYCRNVPMPKMLAEARK